MIVDNGAEMNSAQGIFLQTMALLSGLSMEKKLLVAFSGGSDSVFLVDLLIRKGQRERLILAHVHHHIRGAEADRDAAFCRAFSEKLQLPFVLLQADAPALAKAEKKTLEEAARMVRYRALSDYCAAHPDVGAVATAHHGDDLLESMLQRMLRGTGPDGLCAMLPQRAFPIADGKILPLLRPLLGFTKQDIIIECNLHKLEYVTDSTNFEPDAMRNRIRAYAIPMAQAVNDAYAVALDRLCRGLKCDSDYFSDQVQQFILQYGSGNGVQRKALAALHPALLVRVLSRLYAAFAAEQLQRRPALQLEMTHLTAMQAAVTQFSQPCQISLPHAVTFCCYDDRVFFVWGNQMPPEAAVLTLHSGENILPDGTMLYLGIPEKDKYKNIYKLSTSLTGNSDKLKYNALQARIGSDRPRRYPAGGHNRTIKYLMNACRVPQSWRVALPMVCDADGNAVWLPFCPAADGVQTTDGAPFHLYYFCESVAGAENVANLTGQANESQDKGE